jgi:hypothetical protein
MARIVFGLIVGLALGVLLMLSVQLPGEAVGVVVGVVLAVAASVPMALVILSFAAHQQGKARDRERAQAYTLTRAEGGQVLLLPTNASDTKRVLGQPSAGRLPSK